MIMREQLSCPKCKRPYEVEEFLDCCKTFWPKMSVINWTCKECESKQEIVVEYSTITFGYVYAAGEAHYASVQEVSVPGVMAYKIKDILVLEYEGRKWSVPRLTS